MKVTRLEMTIAPAAVNNRIAGFIEFDSVLDQELRKGENQHPNHYDLKWRRKLPFAIKGYVARQLEAFGISKLGLGKDQREVKRSRRTSAEDWALRQLMKHAAGLDLFGAKGHGPTPPPPPTPPLLKPIGVSIHNFQYPVPEIAPRVNWGSAFSNLVVTAHNRTSQEKGVSLIVQILLGDSVVYPVFQRLTLTLGSAKSFSSPSFEVDVDKGRFTQPGEYHLTATLFETSTGDKLDSVARRFWVEKDPPLRQPFEIQASPEFPENLRYRQWFITGTISSSPTLYYNLAHPCYRNVEDDADLQKEYVFDMVLAGAIQFVLNRPNQEDGKADFHPLDAGTMLGQTDGVQRQEGSEDEIPGRTHEEIQRYASEIRWKVFEGG